jgi:hypothetical protein
MAEKLGLPPKTVERRIQRAGIKPLTREAIYPDDTLEIISKNNKVGRPPKKPETEAGPEAATKAAKPKKKE